VFEPPHRPPERVAVDGVLRRWPRSVDRWDLAAGALITAFLAATLWLTAGGGLYIDDIRAQAYAADRPIWPFIVESNETHLAPSARTVDWLQASYAPLEHWPAVVVTLVVAVTLAVALWVCIRWLVGRPAVAVVGLYLALFSATIVPSLAWYRQALTGVAALALLLVTCIVSVRFVTGGRWFLLPVAAVTHLLALGFSERALVAPVLLLAVLVLLRPGGLRALLWRGVTLLGVLGVVNLMFLAVYFAGDYDKAVGAQPTLDGFVRSTGYSLFWNTIPAYLGGPLRWGGSGIYGFADTPFAYAAFASVVVGSLVVLAFWRDWRRSLRLMTVAAAFIVPIYVMVYVGRIAQVTDISSVNDLRLHTDAAIVGAILLAALLAVAVSGERSPGSSAASRVAQRSGALAAGALALVTVAGSVQSWTGFASRWHTNTSDEYLGALTTELADNTGTVVPGPVPESIVPWWVQPDFSTQSLVLLLSPTTETATMVAPVRAVAPTGTLVAADLVAFDRLPIPEGFCGFTIPPGSSAGLIPAGATIPPRRHQLLEIGLLVGDTTHVGVAVIDDVGIEHPAAFYRAPLVHRGPSRILATVPLDIPVAAVVVKTLDRNTAGTCVISITSVLARATL
jgi:hypothetical protein